MRYSLGEEHRFRESVLLSASQLDIPVIDIDEEVTESRYDPLSLFASRGGGVGTTVLKGIVLSQKQ